MSLKKIGNKHSALLAWCLYDGGNSAFTTIIVTFIFSVYFARSVVGDVTRGSALWGYGLAAAGVLIALLSPVLGALADHYGARRRLLTIFSFLCIAAIAALYFVAPAPGFILPGLILLAVAAASSEIALVFFNAMLPDLADGDRLGRLSNWGWACGYIGGLLSLALALFFCVGLAGHRPLLPLPQNHLQQIRATALLAAGWYGLLMLPLLIVGPDRPRTGLGVRDAARAGLRRLLESCRHVRTQRNLLLFLIASAIYRDGLNTLFAVGGLYAAGTFQMGFTAILIFAITLNVSAAFGAGAFAALDDRLGSRTIILIGLGGLLLTGLAVILTHDRLHFMVLAIGLGAFIGPVQASSRALVARLSPPDTITQSFGLYALTGKATAFAGPFLFGLVTTMFASQRAGLGVILCFWLVGGGLMLFVRERKMA